ncbi:unnamed protein product, partial [marine sediment metagenome]
HIGSLAHHATDCHNWCKYLAKADAFPDSIFEGTRRVTFSKRYHRHPRQFAPTDESSNIEWMYSRLSCLHLFEALEQVELFTVDVAPGTFLVEFFPDAPHSALCLSNLRAALEVRGA